jgi:hypothetical protein
MKIIALEVETAGATAADFEPHLKGEAAHVWELQQKGVIRETFFRTDQHTVVLVLECSDIEQCRALVATFPLVREGLISFDLIPLAPYDGFARLFA